MAQLSKEYFDQKFEEFATMVAKGFENTVTVSEFRDEIKKLNNRITALENEIKALSAKFTTYLELSDKRYLELKRRDTVIAKWIKMIADKTGVNIDLAELEKF